jgi:hypothetical protein
VLRGVFAVREAPSCAMADGFVFSACSAFFCLRRWGDKREDKSGRAISHAVLIALHRASAPDGLRALALAVHVWNQPISWPATNIQLEIAKLRQMQNSRK